MAIKPSYHIGQKLSLVYDDKKGSFVFKEVGDNALALKSGDILVSIQHIPVNGENLNQLWDKYVQYNYSLPQLTLTVNRMGEEKTLTGKLYRGSMDITNYLAPVENPSAEQQKNLQLLLHQQ